MLNYLGPNIGAEPVAASLPTPAPGTIPSGVPGLRTGGLIGAPAGMATPPPMPLSPINGPRPVVPPAGVVSPSLPPAPLPLDENESSSQEYDTMTQEDGTVVLFRKNADGTRGPAVKIINIKAAKTPAS